jgi:hypothetical protein
MLDLAGIKEISWDKGDNVPAIIYLCGNGNDIM